MNPRRPQQEQKEAVMRSIHDCWLGKTCREARGGPVSWSRRSGPHFVLPADRNPFPLSACQPSARAAATASPSGAGRDCRTIACQGRAG